MEILVVLEVVLVGIVLVLVGLGIVELLVLVELTAVLVVVLVCTQSAVLEGGSIAIAHIHVHVHLGEVVADVLGLIHHEVVGDRLLLEASALTSHTSLCVYWDIFIAGNIVGRGGTRRFHVHCLLPLPHSLHWLVRAVISIQSGLFVPVGFRPAVDLIPVVSVRNGVVRPIICRLRAYKVVVHCLL